MIVTAGLTPAWQQILVFDQLEVGEVNRAREAHWCASGKVLNVAVALAHLGANVLAISPVGGLAHAPLTNELAEFHVPACWIDTIAATRVCTTLVERPSGRTTELVENAGLLEPAELSQFTETYTAAVRNANLVVLTGSMPRGTPADFFRRLLERTQAPAILDIRGPELDEALACRPLLVKPNREELGHTFGRPLADEADLRAAMTDLRRRGAQWVMASNGKYDLWVAGSAGFFRFRPPIVQTVNAIGSGDCLAAGMAWRLAAGHDMLECIRVGIAAAALNASALLPGRLVASDVLHLAQSVTMEAL